VATFAAFATCKLMRAVVMSAPCALNKFSWHGRTSANGIHIRMDSLAEPESAGHGPCAHRRLYSFYKSKLLQAIVCRIEFQADTNLLSFLLSSGRVVSPCYIQLKFPIDGKQKTRNL